MWIVNLALRRPYTFIVLAIFILLSGGLAVLKTPKDIFPSINIPVVAVVWTYTGMEPTEVTNHITSVYERVLTATVNNIEHIESQSLSGVAVVKIFLQPTADVTAGIAEVTSVSQAILKQLPPGVAPPEILSYNATDVPVMRLGLGGKGFSEQQLNDYATNFVRPQLITVPGAVVPSPYGGKERYVEVNLNYHAMQARGVTPADVISAVNAQNLILPSGTAKIGQFEYQVGINASPPAIRDLDTLPIKTVNGATIYMRDIGNVINGNIPQTNVVRFNGSRATMLDIIKSGNTSTLDVVQGIKNLLPRLAQTLVSTLIWPRYAREEFFAAGRDALKTASELFSLHKLTYVSAGEVSLEIHKLQQIFDKQFARLTSLKQAGERESAVFSARVGNYNAFMVALNNLFRATLALNRHRGEAWLLKHVRLELESLFDAISEEFKILLGSESPGQRLLASHIEEAFVAFEAKVNEVRAQGMLVEAPLRAAMDFAGEFAVLRRLTSELHNIRGTLEALPRYGQALPAEKAGWRIIPPIDWYWLKVGIKGGLAAVIAVLLIRWTHPPGAANVPTWAWLLVVMRRSFFRTAGASDLRTFEIAVHGSLILAGCALVLIVITPALASYTAMNLVLFLLLFVTGFFTSTLPGVTFWTEFTFLTTSTFVALNPQVAVPPITIIDSFVGTMVGLWIATLVSRVLWPLLPQKVLRDSLAAIFAQTKDLLGGALNREKVLTELTNLPIEAMGAVSQIQIAGCPEEERTNLSFLIHRSQALISRVSQLVSRRPVLRSLGEGGSLLPEVTERILHPHFARLEFEFQQMLDAFTDCFRDGHCSRELPTIRGALTGLDQAVQQIRDRNLLGDLPLEASLRFLDVVNLYHATADSLEECGRLVRSLRIERYCGDCGL
jgi:hypothetical protein